LQILVRSKPSLIFFAITPQAAPKIDDKNVGFKLLAAMGWSEGDRIGLSGGIDAPLTAIIKTTKRGLGATGKFDDLRR
jgi:hypothetical protein